MINPAQIEMMAQQQNGGLSTSQLTPEVLQQWQAYQDQQRKQQLAATLMGNNADPKTAYAGVANAGSDLNGALMLKAMQNQANGPASTNLGQTPGMDASMGGVNRTLPGMNIGSVSSQTPSLGGGMFSGLGKLFNLGGGT